MTIEQEMGAIRSSVALSELDHVSYWRVSGPDAFDGLDAVCPKELFIRDGQMLHTLLLDERACVLADAYVCADDGDFLLLVDGFSPGDLASYLRRHIPGQLEVELHELGSSRRLLALNGPYAWELMAQTFGAEIIGLPYLGFYHDRAFTCFRTGQTGEYGYLLSVPKEEYPRVRAELAKHGREFDLGSAGLAALDCCALENWFFNVRGEGSAGLTPLELQLQWRVSYHKTFPGSAALAERRRARPRQRATLVYSDQELGTGAELYRGGEQVGRLIHAARAHTRGDYLAVALLELETAHPGLSFSTAQGATARSISAPAVDNRSLYVDPQRHSYLTRSGDQFPPLVRGACRSQAIG